MHMKSNAFNFSIHKTTDQGLARVGEIQTPHGTIATPAFSPVATRASVRALGVDDLLTAESQVVLANTYHLYLQPGSEKIAEFGGFGPFMNWRGPTITDSGGYQVSFLWESGEAPGKKVKITDEGATFTSHIDGSTHLLTPENSMEIQQSLAADIIMAFDQPMSSDYADDLNKEAFTRSLLWERRSYEHWRRLEEHRNKGTFQALFGIVHGGSNRDYVKTFSEFVQELDFPGIAIGGEYIGSDVRLTSEALDMANEFRDFSKPVHALGLGGGPEGIIEAVSRGIDLFDNTSITRMARAGLVFVAPSDGGSKKNKYRLNLNNARFKSSHDPISSHCSCYTCQNYSCAYLNHLFKAGELLAYRLTSIHNVYFVNQMMKNIRQAITENSFGALKKEWIG